MYELFKLVRAGPTHLISDKDLGLDMNQVINNLVYQFHSQVPVLIILFLESCLEDGRWKLS